MSSLKQSRRVYRGAVLADIRTNSEMLRELPSSDEHAQSIKYNIEVINKNKKVIESQESSSKPNAKIIAKANDNIATCKETIKERLMHLIAKPEKAEAEIKAVMDAIDAGDIQSVTLKVLEIMARKNPGLHSRKYREALALVAAQKQTVAQPQY